MWTRSLSAILCTLTWKKVSLNSMGLTFWVDMFACLMEHIASCFRSSTSFASFGDKYYFLRHTLCCKQDKMPVARNYLAFCLPLWSIKNKLFERQQKSWARRLRHKLRSRPYSKYRCRTEELACAWILLCWKKYFSSISERGPITITIRAFSGSLLFEHLNIS